MIMTNEEIIEQNIGLTFHFVNHLIDNNSEIEQLPDDFALEFIERNMLQSNLDRDIFSAKVFSGINSYG